MFKGLNKYKIPVVLISGTILLLSFSFRPINNPDCLTEIRSIYKKMNTPPVDAGKTYCFQFLLETALRKSQTGLDQKTASEAELLVSKTHLRYTSKDVNFYQDEKTAVMLVPGKKVVYLSDAGKKENQGGREKQLGMLQDSLLLHMKVVDCKTVQHADYNTIAILAPKGNAGNYFQYKGITFYYNNIKKEIHKIHIDFPDENQLMWTEYTFKKVSFNYPVVLSGNVLNEVLSKGKLKNEFSAYQLVDNRKK